MFNFLRKTIKGRSAASIVASSALTVLVMAAAAQAATVISTSIVTAGDISTSAGGITATAGDITATAGNLIAGGTLSVTGASTLTGAVTSYGAGKMGSLTVGASASTTIDSSGNFAVNTNKFTVAASTGNTVVAGTFGVTGATTLTGNATSSGTFDVNGAGRFNSTFAAGGSASTTVAADGATVVNGTLKIGTTGDALALVKSGSATMGFSGFTTGLTSCVAGDVNITIAGASVGSPVSVGVLSATASTTAAAVTFFGWVDAANTVVVKACNHSTSTTPTIAGATVKAIVLQ